MRRQLGSWSVVLAIFATTSGLVAQDRAALAGLQQDVQLLAQRVGSLQLSVNALETENRELRGLLERQQTGLRELSQRVGTLGDTVTVRLDGLPRREQQLRSEIVAEVAKLIRELEADLQRQLERSVSGALATSAARASTATPSPTSSNTASSAPSVVFDDQFPKTGVNYQVQPGDTLSTIAERHQSRVVWIQKANRISDPRSLRAGQNIFIPQGAE